MLNRSVPFRRKVFWLDSDRFDIKPNKSPWLEMSKALRSNGYNVTIVTGYAEKEYYPSDKNVNIVYISSLQLNLIFRVCLLFKMLIWLIKNVDSNDIVILNPHTVVLAPIIRLAGIVNIHFDVRTLPLYSEMSFKKRIDHWVFWKLTVGRISRLAKSYSFITERLRQEVENEFGLKFQEYVIWQSGANAHHCLSGEIVNHSNGQEELFTIFYHGSIYGGRGVDTVVNAMSLLTGQYKKNIRFVVVGPESGKLNLKDIIEGLGLTDKIVYKGYVPYENIPSEIAEADCCICPLPDLLEWNVSSPLKVFEYMACGKPIILTPISAHKDVIHDEKFIVWTEGYSPESICEAIKYAYDNRVMLSESAVKAPAIVKENYEWKIQGKKLADYFATKFS